MKISKQRLKEIIKEELQEVIDAGGPLARAVGDIEFDRSAKKNAADRRKRGEASTPASTTNLDRFDPSDPDEESTLEMTEKEYEQWRARGFFDKDKF
jgi:hypothetical protein